MPFTYVVNVYGDMSLSKGHLGSRGGKASKNNHPRIMKKVELKIRTLTSNLFKQQCRQALPNMIATN